MEFFSSSDEDEVKEMLHADSDAESTNDTNEDTRFGGGGGDKNESRYGNSKYK